MSIFHNLNMGNNLFNQSPTFIQNYIESVWASGSLGWPDEFVTGASAPMKPVPAGVPGITWDHLIYAYMVENSLAYEILAKVIREYTTGERLGPPDPDAARWLRLTEALFYRHPAATLSYSVESELRPDHRAIRRNAYFRMFGMDLNHPHNEPGYVRPAESNREFVSMLEELLRELWVAIINLNNTSGANPTDNAKLATKAQALCDMMGLRRLGWNMAREEFFSIVTMGWFEYSLSFDSVIVRSMNASAPSAAARLSKMAHRISTPVPRFAHEYFEIAQPLSRLLQLIEGIPDWTAVNAATLYGDPNIQGDVLTVIDNWSRATGRDLKSQRVLTTAPAMSY